MKWTVGKQLAFGFAMIVIFYSVLAAALYYQGRDVDDSQQRVLEVSHPVLVAASEMKQAMSASRADLHGYMAVGDEKFKAQRGEDWRRIDAGLNTLTDYASRLSPAEQRSLADLRERLADMRQTHQAVEAICQDEENFPAIKLLVRETSPLGGEMLDALGAMIEEESKLEKTPQRAGLLERLTTARGALAAGFVELHNFMTAGGDRHQANFRRHWDGCTAAAEWIESQAWLFTPSQREQFARFCQAGSRFEPMPQRLFTAKAKGEENVAGRMLAQDAAPREAGAAAALASFIASRQTAARQDQQALKSETASLFWLLIAGPAAVGCGGLLLGWMVTRRVTRPLNRTLKAMEASAAGDLTQRLEEQGHHEFTRMAAAFNSANANSQRMRGELLAASEQVKQLTMQFAEITPEMPAGTRHTDTAGVGVPEDLAQVIRQVADSSRRLAAKSRQVNESFEQVFGAELEEAETKDPSLAESTQMLAQSSQSLAVHAAQLGQLANQLQAAAVPQPAEDTRDEQQPQSGHGSEVPAMKTRPSQPRTANH